MSAKKKIFQDFHLMVAHKDPVQASRANLHVAYAYATGFGVEQSLSAFRRNVQKCTADGLQIAMCMEELFNESKWSLSEENPVSRYTSFIRDLLRRLVPAPKLDSIDVDLSYESLGIAARKAAQALGAGVIPASTFAVYHRLTHQIPYGASVNEQHPTTGETSLATACRLGDYQATVNLLDRGADPSIHDHCGCLPLHWLCMFDDQHVEIVATRLTQDWGLQNINCKSTTPTVLDVQFPIVLHGTALAFAVTARSIQAVKTLLAAGANALCGFTELDTDWGDRSAITIAVRLHLVDVFSLLWPTLHESPKLRPLPPTLASLPCALPTSSIIERYLIHGRQWYSAMQRMTGFLNYGHYPYESPEILSYAPIEAAVRVMDLRVAESLLKNYYSSHQEAKNQHFRACINAACSGTLDYNESTSLLDFALSQGCNLNAVFALEGRAIDILIDRRQGKILQDWLIRKDPDMTNIPFNGSKSFYPLYDMIENGLSSVVPIEDLLSRGANPNSTKPETNKTALYLATEKHLIGDVRALLKYKADPLAMDGQGTSAFHFAVHNGDISLLNEMLRSVHDVNVPDNDGRSALYAAARLGLTDVVTLLLQYGAISTVRNDPQTALHVAAATGNHGPLTAIIKSGQNVDLRDSDDNTPLLMAIQSVPRTGNWGIMCANSLLEAGAIPNAYGRELAWPVHMVFRHSRGPARFDLIQKLHKFGARLDVSRSDGTSLLHLAAFMHDPLMVQYLLNAGVAPVCRGNRRQTPLHDCVRSKPTLRNGEISKIAIESTCRIVEMLSDAGRQAPFKPSTGYYDAGTHAEGTHGFDTSPGTDANSKRVNIKTKVERVLRKRREERVTAERKRMMAKANRILGYGITLFRDESNTTALELAALRTSDQDVLKSLLRIHRNHLEERSASSQSIKNAINSDGASNGSDVNNMREHQVVVNEGWRAAVGAENWLAVLQFLIHDVPLDLTLLRWPKGGRLLQYSILQNDRNLLKLFLGDDIPLDSGKMLPIQRAGWPKFPKLSREFSVDLYYFWDITRKIRRKRVPGDDDQAFTSRMGMSSDTFAWEKGTTITIDSKGRANARKKVFSVYKQEETLGLSRDEHTLRQIWTHVQSMDLQTSNFYFGISSLPDGARRSRQAFAENSNDHQARLLELVGLCLSHGGGKGSSMAWNDEAWKRSCAPGRTSIPFALVHDVAADERPDAARLQRLEEIARDYCDLIVLIEDPAFANGVVEWEGQDDREWYEETAACLREVLIWLVNLGTFECNKWQDGMRVGGPSADVGPSVVGKG